VRSSALYNCVRYRTIDGSELVTKELIDDPRSVTPEAIRVREAPTNESNRYTALLHFQVTARVATRGGRPSKCYEDSCAAQKKSGDTVGAGSVAVNQHESHAYR
jgi:hypothetical protein